MKRLGRSDIEKGPSSPRDESVRLADRTGISREGNSQRSEQSTRFNHEEVSSIVPRHFELPQWQAYFFFDSSVTGSSISSA
jgi:hypothetical protein